jgi:ABC-type multidrug transport system fused ATPase/permease subunit
MEKSVYLYIWRHSRRQQITLTIMAAASFPFLYLFYELPKIIINEAITGEGASFPVDILGLLSVDQPTYLFILCGAFLSLVLVNQSFKYVINVYKGLTGERMLRRLRFDLFARVLRFPLPTFRKMSQGEIIPMITAEVEPLGGFIGDALSLPAFQGGTLLTILGFLFYQDWRMALAAVLLYPLQVWLIPKLQRKVNLLGKERVRRVRKLSDRIGETVQGVQEIRAHDASSFVLTDFASQLNDIFNVRYGIYKQKFVIKFLNNFIQQLGPFFFYSIGGYFVINGELEIGTLMAAIAAHKDLASPWKELLSYYQMQADAKIKYDAVISQFEPAGIRGPEQQMGDPETEAPLTGELAAANLTLMDDQEVAVVDSVSMKLDLGKSYAILGAAGSGKDYLVQLLATLLDPDKGSLTIGGIDAGTMLESISGRRMAYVGPTSFIFAGSLSDNLFFGLKHRPLQEPAYEDDDARARSTYVAEAERSGNITHDLSANWIDYKAAGVENAAGLRQEALRVLSLIEMGEEIYQFGWRGTIDPVARPDLAEGILRARSGLRQRLREDSSLAQLVETFEDDSYNTNANVAENLMFGTPVDESLDAERLAENEYVRQVLEDVGLTEKFLTVGYQVAATMVELFADLPPDHELFQQFSFVAAEDLPDIQAMLQRTDRQKLDEVDGADRDVLLSLPFKLIPARHRLGLIDDEMQNQLLKARTHFAENLPDELRDSVAFFDVDRYNAAANIQDNILFGKIAYGQAQAMDRVNALVREVVDEMDLREVVSEAGLGFDVGIAGSRLSAAQRQKLAIGRAVLKRPDIAILSEATTALDSGVQAQIMKNLLGEFAGRCLIWSVQRPSMAESFDAVLVLRQGRVVDQGPFEEIKEGSDHVKELLAAE